MGMRKRLSFTVSYNKFNAIFDNEKVILSLSLSLSLYLSIYLSIYNLIEDSKFISCFNVWEDIQGKKKVGNTQWRTQKRIKLLKHMVIKHMILY